MARSAQKSRHRIFAYLYGPFAIFRYDDGWRLQEVCMKTDEQGKA
jgi:hypothetical protein